MKRIRILTGLHAGVSMLLAAGRTVIGGGEDADILVSDWNDDDLVLFIDEQNQAFIVTEATIGHNPQDTVLDTGNAPEQGAPHPTNDTAPAESGREIGSVARAEVRRTRLEDFAPRRHGSIVLCLGPDAAPWPPDIELLETLYVKPKARPGHIPWRAPALIGGGALACGAAMVCAALLGSEAGLASTRPHPYSPELAATQLRRELSAAGLGDLAVQVHGDALQVSGYVPNGPADVTARNIVASHTDIPITPRYHVATNDAQTIAQTIGQPDVRVAYSGGGVFTVTGTVPIMADFNTALEQARKELDGQAKLIDSGVVLAASRAPVQAYTSLISAGSVRYIRTPDGVKHVFPGDAAPPSPPPHNDVALNVNILSTVQSATPEPGPAAASALPGPRSESGPVPPLPPGGLFTPLPPLPSNTSFSKR